MTMYIIRETTEYVAVVNGEEKVLKSKVRIPVSTDSIVDTLVYGRKFMENRVRLSKEDDNENLIEVRDNRTDSNEISLLMKGEDAYCECVYKNEDVMVIQRLFCKLEKV